MKTAGLAIRILGFVMFTLAIPFVNQAAAADPQVAAGYSHTAGLKSDGTVVTVGDNDDGQCDVDSWTDITQVAAGNNMTAGLIFDGTVVAVGNNDDGQCDVDSWTGITQVVSGLLHTVGLKSDGTAVAVGDTEYNQCDVDAWTGITQVAAGGYHTVGLTSDGTVVAVGDNGYGQSDVESWSDIKQVAAGGGHTVGLKSDGTVKAAGDNDYGQCDVESWSLGCGPPDQVTLTSPVDTVGTSKPSFVWEENCTVWYYLWVRTADGATILWEAFEGGEICSGGICGTTGDIAMGLENGDYTWAVGTWNENGYGPWSDEMAFTVDVERDEN